MMLRDLMSMVAIDEVVNEMMLYYDVSAELRALIEECKNLKNAKPAKHSSNWMISIEEDRNGSTVAVLRQEGKQRDLTLSAATLLTLPVEVQSKDLRMLFPESQLAVILMSRVAFRYGRRPENYIKKAEVASGTKDTNLPGYKKIPLDKTVLATKNQRFLQADTSPIVDIFEDFLCYVDTPDELFVVPENIHIIMGDAFAFAAQIKEIRIEHDVRLEPCAFRGCKVEKIMLPEGLKRIEAFTFAGCKKLREVVIPDSVEYIGEGAFEDCTALKSVRFPVGLKVIGPRAFCHSGIGDADICAAVVEKEAFLNCKALRKVELRHTVRIVKDCAFAECTSLYWVGTHAGLLALGDYAFRNCKRIRRILLPPTVWELGKQCFRGIPTFRIGMTASLKAFADDLFEGTCMKDDAPHYGKEDHLVFEPDVQIEYYGR